MKHAIGNCEGGRGGGGDNVQCTSISSRGVATLVVALYHEIKTGMVSGVWPTTHEQIFLICMGPNCVILQELIPVP